MRVHGDTPRGARQATLSPLFEGRFGRLFRRLGPLVGPDDPEALRAHVEPLAAQMVEATAPAGWGGTIENLDNPLIPAGYTYLGQFIDHDLTFDPVSSLDRQNDPDALTDFRTPRFDLDSLYGSGPADEPFQYALGDPWRLLVGSTAGGERDLPRNSEGLALIGDPRNDENVIVAQIHLVFLLLHNKFLTQVRSDPSIDERRHFAEAQRLTRWHYQWVVVHDFVRRIIGQAMFDQIYVVDDDGIPNIKLKYFKFRTKPYMPVEFSAAAYRFGHSMIRGIYNLNDQVVDKPIFLPGDAHPVGADLRGRRPLLDAWQIEWPRFFEMDAATIPQPSRLIDAKLVPALSDLPGPDGSLATLNLMRGYRLGLPSGQDVAKLLKAPRVFSGIDLGAPLDPTPLWFYILKESELELDADDAPIGGRHLGTVGGRIVGEVLLGLLNGDTQSYINQEPAWRPDPALSTNADGVVTMGDLIKFATT